MGCCGSKVDDLPLVNRCRERKDLLKAAADHRYALAAAHLSYFISLKGVGEALRKFVDEELVYTTSSSSTSSPVVTFHTIDDDDEEDEKVKKRKTLGRGNGKNKSKSESESKSLSSDDSGSGFHHGHGHNDDNKDTHLHLSDDDSEGQSHVHLDNDDDDDEDQGGLGGVYGRGRAAGSSPGSYPGGYSVPYGYGVINESINQPLPYWGPFPYYFGGGQPYQAWAPPSYDDPNVNHRDTNVYYMKRSSPVVKTVIHQPRPATNEYASEFFSYPYENEGFYEVPTGSSSQVGRGFEGRKQSGPKVPPDPPPPPPSPKGSTWDFLNPFDVYDGGFTGYYAQGGYGNPNGYGSSVSSPDSAEVRKREGIPDLEEETENEIYGEVEKGKKVNVEVKRSYPGGGSSNLGPRAVPLHKISEDPKVPLGKSREGDFKSVPLHRSSDGSSMSVPMPSPEQNFTKRDSRRVTSEYYESTGSIHLSEEMSSSETVLSSKSPEDVSVRKKEVSFELDETPKPDVDSSKLDNLTALSTHGTRDLREVVAEIHNEFAIATDYGKEVALMLEVGKLPYQHSLLKVMLSRILFLKSSSFSTSYQPSVSSARLAAKSNKLAKLYFGDFWNDIEAKPRNLSATLEELYVWEKKLYNEVKAEEKLRVIYEKQCKRLQLLDEKGAESSKIDALRASIRKLLTKLNICMKTIETISSRIHKLRDEELQPQVANLIHKLITMWKSMLGCHQKQFQAIMESKMRTLKANTSVHRESSLRASRELEMELMAWSTRFNDWINTQKSYVQSLNGWLMRCLQYEPEETPDGPVPYSPGRLGAPSIFLICNDWHQAMETISNIRVANAMHDFASSLRELWEKQDEEQRQRVRAEDLLPNDVKNRLRKLQLERGRTERELDAMSDKTLLSIVLSEIGVSPFDDLKVDLDLVRKKLAEERAKHKDAIKIVHDAASSSVQGGLVPIFKILESFSSEALKAHEQVRFRSDGETS